VAHVDGQDGVTNFQRRRTDKQVTERDNHTLALLLSVNPARQQRSFFRVRIDLHNVEQFADEQVAAVADVWRLRALDAMHEFCQADRRQNCSLVACRGNDLFEHLGNVIASAFGGDDHAGVEDQSHAGGLRGSR
jgi:hypothetical protein